MKVLKSFLLTFVVVMTSYSTPTRGQTKEENEYTLQPTTKASDDQIAHYQTTDESDLGLNDHKMTVGQDSTSKSVKLDLMTTVDLIENVAEQTTASYEDIHDSNNTSNEEKLGEIGQDHFTIITPEGYSIVHTCTEKALTCKEGEWIVILDATYGPSSLPPIMPDCGETVKCDEDVTTQISAACFTKTSCLVDVERFASLCSGSSSGSETGLVRVRYICEALNETSGPFLGGTCKSPTTIKTEENAFGYIWQTGYPVGYFSMSCSWTILGKDGDMTAIRVLDLDMENDGVCDNSLTLGYSSAFSAFALFEMRTGPGSSISTTQYYVKCRTPGSTVISDRPTTVISFNNGIESSHRGFLLEYEAFRPPAEYIGCYYSQPKSKVSDVFRTYVTQWELSKCLEACAAEGYQYASTELQEEYYVQCRCQSSLGKPRLNYCYFCKLFERWPRKLTDVCGINDEATVATYLVEQTVKYLGCFSDRKPFDLPFSASTIAVNRPVDACIDQCRTSGFPYAGVKYRKELTGKTITCHCGNAFGRYGAETEACQACGENRYCGSKRTIAVYDTGAWEAKRPEFRGCWMESSDSKKLDITTDVTSTVQGDLTVSACMNACRSRSELYAALQAGRTCYCGDAYGSLGPANTSCNEPCPGSEGPTTCGGRLANEVYAVSEPESWDEINDAMDKHYFGCFNIDQIVMDQLPSTLVPPGGSSERDTSSLLEDCKDRCSEFSYILLGLFQDGKCTCTNHLEPLFPPTQAKSFNCFPCEGDSFVTCGGFKAAAVYRSDSLLVSRPTPPQWVTSSSTHPPTSAIRTTTTTSTVARSAPPSHFTTLKQISTRSTTEGMSTTNATEQKNDTNSILAGIDDDHDDDDYPVWLWPVVVIAIILLIVLLALLIIMLSKRTKKKEPSYLRSTSKSHTKTKASKRISKPMVKYSDAAQYGEVQPMRESKYFNISMDSVANKDEDNGAFINNANEFHANEHI